MIAIVDYKAGNLRSVERALKYLNLDCCITSDHDQIMAADRVIFPGVGAAGKAMETILAKNLHITLSEFIASGKPFMGICLGTQIIMDHSAEDNTACLGFVPGDVLKFKDIDLKIPHMGWNNIDIKVEHPVLANLSPEYQFYFVHSYYPAAAEYTLAECSYGIRFTAVLGKDNVVATQFHPEKSGQPGLQILENFSRWEVTLASRTRQSV